MTAAKIHAGHAWDLSFGCALRGSELLILESMMMSTYPSFPTSVLASPDDLHEGAALLFDSKSNELILKAWSEDAEIAFLRIGLVEAFSALGIDRYIQAEIKRGVADVLVQRFTALDIDARRLRNEAAELICPFQVGDVITIPAKKGHLFEVRAIHPRHQKGWEVSCVRVSESGQKLESHFSCFTEFDQPRGIKPKQVGGGGQR